MSRELKFRAWDSFVKKFKYGRKVVDHYTNWEEYTGLKDKNGKEIYVGDILETCCGKAEAYFDDELLMYKIKVKHGGTMPLVSKNSKRHFDYEIIGNVHENPELLGGGE